jgi:hypothetical protein
MAEQYHNFYKCPDCGHGWEGHWDCGCDDDCPECGCRNVSPYRSVKCSDEAHMPLDGKVPHRLTVRVPVEVAFTTDPAELECAGKGGERKPDKEALLQYLKDALRLDIDTEGEGQPEGAVFAAAGIDWGQAEVRDG